MSIWGKRVDAYFLRVQDTVSGSDFVKGQKQRRKVTAGAVVGWLLVLVICFLAAMYEW